MRIKSPKYITYITLGIIIICILSVIGIVILLVSKHTHTFGEWELFKEPTCSEYGVERRFCACGEMQEKKNDRIDHTEGEWIVYTETSEKVLLCSVCGKRLKVESLENHTHSYGEWVTTVEPTCTTGGLMTRTCRCGAKEEKPISTGNHSFGDWAVERESTCTEKGIMSRHCECGAKEEKELDLAKHRYGDWEVEYASTCTRNGLQVRYCECGTKDEKELALADHSFSEWYVLESPKCEVYGVEERACTCGLKEQRNTHALEHEFTSWQVSNKPTCTSKGKEERSCIHCSKPESRDISPLGHGNTYKEMVGIYVNECCERCDAVLATHRIEDSMNLNIDGTTLFGIGTCQDQVVSIPSGITTIASKAFKDVSTIKIVVLPNTVRVISDRAFANCDNLEAIYIDISISEISFYVFQFSGNLKSIYYNGTIDQWNSINKDPDWDYGMEEYTIYCTDGNIEK